MRTAIRLCLILASVVALSHAQSARPTARQIIADIQKHVGLEWSSDTVDTVKAGNPDTPVTGIAVTMMATMDVLERAASKGLNLVITHEPTFYSHLDTPAGMPADDPIWAEKRAFIEAHHMVVWRFHDYWHAREPDGIEVGVVHALGWEKFESRSQRGLFTVPEISVEHLAADVAHRLNSPVVRIVGDPALKVTKLALSPGAAGFKSETRWLERADVEVLLVGETHEWETVEYVADAATEGRKKALIVIGHIPSEQAGTEECARWLKQFVTDVPLEFVPAKQPFTVVK